MTERPVTPLPPPHLYTLEDDEVTCLRSIYRNAKAYPGEFFRQSDFMKIGSDIRNFLGENNARPGHKLLSMMYNFAVTTMYDRAHSNPLLLAEIEKLIDMGIRSGRYSRDINLYMNEIIDNHDIKLYNAELIDCKLYIGYRYLTGSEKIIRFYVSIFYDKQVDRTRFVAYTNLGLIERKTRGLAYQSRGTVSLSGFLNKGLGCEFMSFRPTGRQEFKSGVMITTVKGAYPVAKQFMLVDAELTVYPPDALKPGQEAKRDTLRECMRLSSVKECYNDFRVEKDYELAFRLFTRDAVESRDEMDGERA